MGREGHVFWYYGMPEDEASEMARKFGERDIQDAMDKIEDALLRHCKSVLKESGGNDFVSYDIEVWSCPEPGIYVIEETRYKGDEANSISYTAVESKDEATEEARRALRGVAEWLSEWIDDARDMAKKKKGWEREAWEEIANTLETEAESLEELAGRLRL